MPFEKLVDQKLPGWAANNEQMGFAMYWCLYLSYNVMNRLKIILRPFLFEIYINIWTDYYGTTK